LSIAKRKGATVLSESDIEQLSPAAAVASRLLKGGMTLTQVVSFYYKYRDLFQLFVLFHFLLTILKIYSEYVNLTENLQNEKSENERLRSCVDELVKDIEEKAPLLIRQNHEYEESLKTISNLSTQLENAMIDYEVLKSKSEDSVKKYNFICSENIRLKQDVNDMSRQVTALLNENEKLRGKLLRRSSFAGNESNLENSLTIIDNEQNNSISLAEVSSSSEVISKNLIVFRYLE
jgi:nucleoprotein TPR